MKIKVKFKRSRISFFYNYLLSSFLLLSIPFLHSLKLDISILYTILFTCSSLTAILISEPEVERSYRHYLLEEENVTMVEGILSKKRVSIPYNQIVSITILKTPLGRILKFGDVKVSSLKAEIILKGVRYPDKIYSQIQEKIKSSKKD